MPSKKGTKKIKINFQPKKTANKLLSVLKDREREVIDGRFGLSNESRRTLDSLGKGYGITRERVRQIEDAALRSIRSSSNFEEARAVFDELKEIIEDHGGIVSEEYFLDQASSDPIIKNHLNFYLVLGDDFKKFKEDKDFKARWATDEDLAEKIHNALHKLHDDLDESELLTEEKMVMRFLDGLDGVKDGVIREDVAKLFLLLSKVVGSNALGAYGLTSSRNISARGIRDKAYLVMQKSGSPMHFSEVAREITKEFGAPANPATCHNELIKDDRMVLVGRGVYALKEWGYRSGVLREVIQELLREKGPMTREEIIENVLRERYLKKNTIMVNLQNPRYFKKDENGLYHLA